MTLLLFGCVVGDVVQFSRRIRMQNAISDRSVLHNSKGALIVANRYFHHSMSPVIMSVVPRQIQIRFHNYLFVILSVFHNLNKVNTKKVFFNRS